MLPVATLTVQIIASWSRFQRASMLDVLSSDYIRTARAKGVPRKRVIFKHGLRNALIPFVTVMALDIGALFGGLIITEQIFSIPGMGRLFVARARERRRAGRARVVARRRRCSSSCSTCSPTWSTACSIPRIRLS